MQGYGIRDQQQKNGVGSERWQRRDLGSALLYGDQDPVVRHNNKDYDILNAPYLEEPASIFQLSCIFAVTVWY